MRSNTLILSLAAFGMMGGVALAAPPSWQGTFFVTQASSGCASSGNNVGEFGTMLYRPILNQGDPSEGISFFFPRSTETIIPVKSNTSFRGQVNYQGVETGHGVFPNSFKGSSDLSISPTTISSSTGTVTIKGTVNNFFNNSPTCNVTIDAVLLPRL